MSWEDTRRQGSRPPVIQRLAAGVAVLLVTVVLAGCEYADTDTPAGAGAASPRSMPDSRPFSPSAGDLSRERLNVAAVEAQLGPESDRRVISMLGGMDSQGSTLLGLVPDRGAYLIRAACSRGPAARLTVSQDGTQLVDLNISCGTPHQSTVELAAGRVSAMLAPTAEGQSSVAGMRLETMSAGPATGASPGATAAPSADPSAGASDGPTDGTSVGTSP